MTMMKLDMSRAFIFFIFIVSFIYGNPLWYEVKKGDDFVRISQKLKVNYNDLQFYNQGIKRLKVGSRLKIPPFEYHKVSSGESYHSIAQKYDLDYKELMRLNISKKIMKADVIRLRKVLASNEKKSKIEVKKEVPLKEPLPKKEPLTVKMKKDSEGPIKMVSVEAKAISKEMTEDDSLSNVMEEQKKIQLYELIRNKSFVFPAKGSLDGFYGLGDNIMNYGINLKLDDEKIYASEAGVINYVGNMRGVGKVVLVSHGGGIFSLYSGDMKIKVKKGQKVSRKEMIGTGESNIFFSVYKEGDPFNPFALLLN